MKKVLIISYYFAQNESIGSIRLQGLTKFLPYFGWEPTILTIKANKKTNSNNRIIETPYDDILIKWKKRLGLKPEETVKGRLNLPVHKNKKTFVDNIYNWWEEIFAYPDANKGWYKYAVDAGDKLLENESFDAIISSSSPVTTHLIAKKLKDKHDIPWIADLRPMDSKPLQPLFLFQKIYRKKIGNKNII